MTTRYEGHRPSSAEELRSARDLAITAFERTVFRTLRRDTFSQPEAVIIGRSIVRRHLTIAENQARLAGCNDDTDSMIETINQHLRLRIIVSASENNDQNPLREYFLDESDAHEEHSKDIHYRIEKGFHLKISETWKKIAEAIPVTQRKQ